jgi:hypothetical protein
VLEKSGQWFLLGMLIYSLLIVIKSFFLEMFEVLFVLFLEENFVIIKEEVDEAAEHPDVGGGLDRALFPELGGTVG